MFRAFFVIFGAVTAWSSVDVPTRTVAFDHCQLYAELARTRTCSPRREFRAMVKLAQKFCGRFQDYARVSIAPRLELQQRTIAFARQHLNDSSKSARDVQKLTSRLERARRNAADLERVDHWVWSTMDCLQTSLTRTLTRESTKTQEMSCDAIYRASVDDHLACYRTNGFCQIGRFWREILFDVIGIEAILRHPTELARMPRTCNSAAKFFATLPALFSIPR